MNDVDRDIGLALLKRLRQRGLISEEAYTSASHSRFFDKKYFVNCTEQTHAEEPEEAQWHGDD